MLEQNNCLESDGRFITLTSWRQVPQSTQIFSASHLNNDLLVLDIKLFYVSRQWDAYKTSLLYNRVENNLSTMQLHNKQILCLVKANNLDQQLMSQLSYAN